MKAITLIPAYGRDYTKRAAIEADLTANLDFLIRDIGSRQDGRYATARDLKASGYTHAKVRYAKSRKVTMVKL